jgi:hypothetical protein
MNERVFESNTFMALPPQPLNMQQRREICALLGTGGTRRLAARFAACRVLDIHAEMKNDPEFRKLVRQHELRPEIEVLKSVLNAACDPKQWRAGAWTLERLYPRRYAARRGDSLQHKDIRAFLESLDKLFAPVIPNLKERLKYLEQRPTDTPG